MENIKMKSNVFIKIALAAIILFFAGLYTNNVSAAEMPSETKEEAVEFNLVENYSTRNGANAFTDTAVFEITNGFGDYIGRIILYVDYSYSEGEYASVDGVSTSIVYADDSYYIEVDDIQTSSSNIAIVTVEGRVRVWWSPTWNVHRYGSSCDDCGEVTHWVE